MVSVGFNEDAGSPGLAAPRRLAALAEQLGGMEEFETLMTDYHSMVQRDETQLVRERNTGWSSRPTATR